LPGPLFAGMAFALATAPIASSDFSLEDLRAIEEELQKDAEPLSGAPPRAAASPTAGRSLANPDLSLTLDAAAAAFSRKDSLMTGAHDPARTGFNLQQLELGIEAPVDPYFTFKNFTVFSPFGVETEEPYATTIDLPWNLRGRAGQFFPLSRGTVAGIDLTLPALTPAGTVVALPGSPALTGGTRAWMLGLKDPVTFKGSVTQAIDCDTPAGFRLEGTLALSDKLFGGTDWAAFGPATLTVLESSPAALAAVRANLTKSKWTPSFKAQD